VSVRTVPFGVHWDAGLRDQYSPGSIYRDNRPGAPFPGVPGHEPDAENAALGARLVGQTMNVLRMPTPGAGSYVNETDYFEPDWQDRFWGPNHPRLLGINRRYDPQNVFRVHHGVGSEAPG
jgi:hypothetical protein